MIRVLCPRGHFIASVDIIDGAIIPRGVKHGMTWDYAPSPGITRLRATCRRFKYDGSTDPQALTAELAAAEATGHAEYRLTT